MQTAQLLTQADQFVLVALVLAAQELPNQGSRARRRVIALDPRLTQAVGKRRLDHQQPGRMRKPRTIP
ncbi:hypothetical protein ACFSHT_28860 [Paraburkholderia silviterrae]|uniref:hypothetical protein n=1 Tax=Paraburkholderia silviterrae TaxID=2528715 RepID=UPI00140441AA|nr:hypothetical protein [Paraburkholderia silviterrae]